MNKIEYLKYAITKELYTKINWFFTFFGICNLKELSNEYIRPGNNGPEVYVDGEWVTLNNIESNDSIYRFGDKITIDGTWCPNVKGETKTTIGRLMANCVLLVYNFGDKIDYPNFKVSIEEIETIIGGKMRSGVINVEEYLNFVDAVSFITMLSKLTNISATYKSINPPPGLDKYKKELKAQFDKDLGPGWDTNISKVQQFQDKLKEFDKNWIKDDPSYGKMMKGKIVNNSRPKMYLSIGGEAGFDSKSGNVEFISTSLLDQYPNDDVKLAALFNSSRSGSYSRGAETQKGGAAAKDILRSTSGIKILKGDCGSTKGFKISVTKNNHESLYGRYLLDGTKIENTLDYLNKDIVIRSPMYCLTNGDSYCSICAGDVAASTPTGTSLKLLKVSSTLLKISLKAMHNTTVSIHKFNILENLK